jgi:hypothetical protein
MQTRKTAAWTGVLALVLAFMAPQLKADVQARLNVLAHALASSDVKVQTLAVGGFTDDSGQRPPFALTLEADLRRALARHKKHWKVLGMDAPSSGADAMLSGTFRRSGADIQVHAELRSQPDGGMLWQRNAILDGADVTDTDLSGAPAASPQNVTQVAEGPMSDEAAEVIPTVPGTAPTERSLTERSDNDAGLTDGLGNWFDCSLAYKAFLPTNGNFQSAAGKVQNAVSVGVDIDDIFLWDVDFWDQAVSNLGSAQSLVYNGTDFALVYPFHLGEHVTLYVGPGGRFGEISVNDPALWDGGVGFGNNALEAVAGIKVRSDNVGLDLRYSGDLVYSYTGYNTLRIGAFYEFGR